MSEQLQLTRDLDRLTLAHANRELDDAISIRVDLHERREAGEIDAPCYIAGLAWVRAVEDALEPIRRCFGCECSRAMELVLEDEG